jgi:arylformamidase
MTTDTDPPRSAALRPALDPAALEARRAAAVVGTEALRARFRHELGVAYGERPRQVMDLYYPTQANAERGADASAQAAAAPVLVFLHGGGFRLGEPGRDGYHGLPVLERGGVFVSMGYRLAPEVRFPDTCGDVEQGLRWLREHLGERGADPDRIYLSGHSAGAMLAAGVGLRTWPAGTELPADLVKGLVLISGMYDLARELEQQPDIVNGASSRYVPSLLDAIDHVPDHTIVVVGEEDFPRARHDAPSLVEALRSREGSVELFVEPGADHFAANRSFVEPGGAVSEATARMMGLR